MTFEPPPLRPDDEVLAGLYSTPDYACDVCQDRGWLPRRVELANQTRHEQVACPACGGAQAPQASRDGAATVDALQQLGAATQQASAAAARMVEVLGAGTLRHHQLAALQHLADMGCQHAEAFVNTYVALGRRPAQSRDGLRRVLADLHAAGWVLDTGQRVDMEGQLSAVYELAPQARELLGV